LFVQFVPFSSRFHIQAEFTTPDKIPTTPFLHFYGTKIAFMVFEIISFLFDLVYNLCQMNKKRPAGLSLGIVSDE